MAGLYIHIPFCHSKCAYCDFYSMPRTEQGEEYVEALRKEYLARIDEVGVPDTIYIGGGTPSSLPIALLERIFTWIPTDKAREITMEVNPEDVTADFARWLATSPVNRVSMGVQSLNDSELAAIGRHHTAHEAIDAYHRLRAAGISNISLDLIFGLPGQSIRSWSETLREILDLQPQHLSAYTLMLEEGTRLWARNMAGKLTLPSDEDVESMYRTLCNETAERMYDHYEISNFAKPGRASLHNSSYWNLTPYLGLGPGAHSFDGILRRYNPSSLKDYLLYPTTHTIIDTETPRERINDYIMIHLRTAAGLSLSDLKARYGAEAANEVTVSARPHLRCGYLEENAPLHIRIPERYFLIADTIISDLMLLP